VNTRTVDPRTTWAVLTMEAALVLPIMSLPTQGDRIPGLLGPLLLLALLPAGCAAVYRFPTLRDPTWRLLTGIGLALLTRVIVENVPDAGLNGLLTWLGRSVVPAAIGIGLWWRGGALAVAELTPGDVRSEFSVVAVCLLISLAFARPFLLADPSLLGCAVALFAVGGLIGAALSRQDAADVFTREGRTLAVGTSLLLPAVTVGLVGSLRPDLLTAMWLFIAHAIELLLTPIGLLLAWIASLFPKATPGPPPTPVPLPTRVAVDPAAIADAQNRMAWIGTLIVFTLLIAAGLALLLAAKLLLSNVIGAPTIWRNAVSTEDVLVESSGTPGGEASDLFAWLRHWLRAHLTRRRTAATAGALAAAGVEDAWAAYQRLLAWADERGLGRRPSETTGQLRLRLGHEVPEAAPGVDVVTRAFERERYGGVAPPAETLRRVREAMRDLLTG
jgi:Domain of unknown function (DUF4129)